MNAKVETKFTAGVCRDAVGSSVKRNEDIFLKSKNII
jgi:hypothetical protein